MEVTILAGGFGLNLFLEAFLDPAPLRIHIVNLLESIYGGIGETQLSAILGQRIAISSAYGNVNGIRSEDHRNKAHRVIVYGPGCRIYSICVWITVNF
jgi:hypothetical protein